MQKHRRCRLLLRVGVRWHWKDLTPCRRCGPKSWRWKCHLAWKRRRAWWWLVASISLVNLRWDPQPGVQPTEGWGAWCRWWWDSPRSRTRRWTKNTRFRLVLASRSVIPYVQYVMYRLINCVIVWRMGAAPPCMQGGRVRSRLDIGVLVRYKSLIGLIKMLIPTICNFFFGRSSPNNSQVKCAWPGTMDDYLRSSFRCAWPRTKCEKNMCWSIREFLRS